MTFFRFKLIVVIFISSFTANNRAETFQVMLHTGSFPPYFFDEGDSRTGTIRDIFSALVNETGDSIEYVRVPFKRALRQFEIGKIDIEPMTNPLFRKDASVQGVYSIPFASAEEVILFNADKYIPVHSPEDLLGKTIGIVKGYHYPAYDPYFSDARITTHALLNENKLIQLLLAGRIEQALINKDFAQYQIKKQGLKELLVIGATYDDLDMMIRFHPNKKSAVPRFNAAIQKLLDNGTIEGIYARYR